MGTRFEAALTLRERSGTASILTSLLLHDWRGVESTTVEC